MANLYKRYMRLLDKWPVDNSKSPDFGLYLREQAKVIFAKGENTKIEDKAKCEEQIQSLERLASNYYGNKFPCNFTKTSIGLTKEQCNAALSPEIQKLLAEQKLGFFASFVQKIKNTWTRYSSSSKEAQ